MDKRERAIMVLTSSGHFLSHLGIGFFPGIVEPLRADFSLNFAEAVHLSFPGYLAFGLCALPAGFLATRYPARKLILGGQALIALCAFGAATSTTPGDLLYWFLGIGVGASVYHPVGYTLVSNSIRARGAAHGLQGLFGNIGIAIAPLLGGACSYLWSWRVAFVALAICALVSGLIGALFPFDEVVVEPTSQHQAVTRAAPRKHLLLLIAMGFAVTFAGFVYRGAELLLPKHLGDWVFGGALGDNPVANLKGASLAALALVFASFGQILGGYLADKLPLARGYLLFHALSFPFLLGLAWLSGFMLPICAALYGFFSLGMQPFENSLVARLVPPHLRSIGYGVKFVLTFGIGALAVEYVGHQTHAGGTTAAGFAGLAPFVVLLLLSAAALIFLDRNREESGAAP